MAKTRYDEAPSTQRNWDELENRLAIALGRIKELEAEVRDLKLKRLMYDDGRQKKIAALQAEVRRLKGKPGFADHVGREHLVVPTEDD